MTNGGGYQKLARGSTGPGICEIHRLLNQPKVSARMDAARLRSEAEADTPGTLAQARQCGDSEVWHIFIPTKQRMRTLRKRARKTSGTAQPPKDGRVTERPPRPGHCPVCKHPWDDHAEDGCQAQVHAPSSPGTYDCDCMEGGT